MNQPIQRYTKTAIVLHWLIALLIIGMLAMGLWMAELPKDAPKVAEFDLFNLGLYTVSLPEPVSVRTFYFNLHKSCGLTLLALILLRVFWRVSHQAPEFPATMKAWEKKLSHAVHHSLYLLMLLVPVSGFVMSIYSKYGVAWFGTLLVNGLDNPQLRDLCKEAHEFTAWLLLVIAALHIAAAIKHKMVDKDEVMRRMSLRG
ncbi:MAG TPA: cytochrome b [Methylophilaceae bacterium]|nr:cytochrome b [Methylophilaceae bacterium]HQR61222.1 cytochrome b [Methylophilaceae bacterium]